MAEPRAPSRRIRIRGTAWALAATLTSAVLGLPPASAAPERQVLLVVVPGLTYDRALADPVLSRLARAGGIGLLTTVGGADLPARTGLALGAGGPVRESPAGAVRIALAGRGLQVLLDPYVDRAGAATPGLLGSTLAAAGLTVGYADPGLGGGHTAALAAMDELGRIPLAWLARAEAGAADGGASARDVLEGADLIVGPSTELVRPLLEGTDAAEVLVVVVGAGASPAMRERGETVNAIVLAHGEPAALLEPEGEPEGLTSETTRRAGVVAEVDVAPTVLGFLGAPVPAEMPGAPIRTEGDPPTGLHRRFLELRAVVGPAGLTSLAFALLVLAAALARVFGVRGARASRALLAGVVLSASLLVVALPASWLPSFHPPVLTLALVGGSGALAALAFARGHRDPRAAVATVGAVGLALVVLDGLLGWPSGPTPMLGGGALDGERFFGLGNAWAGVVLAGAVLGAARLRRRAGLWLLVAAAAFAGLPFLGADLGGCLTLSAAAALWLGLPRWRLGVRTWTLVALALAAAAAAVSIADRTLPGGGTHLSGPEPVAGALVAFAVRLIENVRTTSATPAAWLTVIGLGVWLALALRPPARLRRTLEADPRWRDAILVLALCGLLGWIVNDTYGLAGSAFLLASAAVLAPALGTGARAPTGSPTG